MYNASSHTSFPSRRTLSPVETKDATNLSSPVKRAAVSPRPSPRKSPRPKYYPLPTPPLVPRSGSESGVSSSSGYKFSSSSTSTPSSVGSGAPSPISPDLFSPALEASPLPNPGLPLKLYIASDAETQTLGTIDASEEVCIFIRGDRSQMAELEVALVCLAEANETVYKLRISRRGTVASSKAAAPSLRHKYSNLAPGKLLCTPPVPAEMLERTSYFPTTKSNLRNSPRTIRKATSGPLSPQRRISVSSPTFTKTAWNAALARGETPMLGTPKVLPAHRSVSPRAISKNAQESVESTLQEARVEKFHASIASFGPESSAVAQAYRAARVAKDGGDPEAATPSSTTSFDSSLLHSPERSLKTQRSDISLSPRRSPQHRYALYVPPGGAAPEEGPRTAVTESALQPAASVKTERASLISAFDTSKPARQPTPEWDDYTSTYDGYVSSTRPQSSDGQALTKASPSLSISSLSPPSSPSALLQRRLASKPQSQLQESTFKLGLGFQGIDNGAILGELSSSHSESTVAPLSTCSTSKDDDVKSLSSLRYAGKQGWSATDDEHSSSDVDSASDHEHDGFGHIGGVPSDTESTSTFGLADYDMRFKSGSGSGGNTSGSGSGDNSEIDISMPKSP